LEVALALLAYNKFCGYMETYYFFKYE